MNRALWPMLIGFSLWALAFTGLYALQHLGCFWGWDPALHRALLVVGYLATLALLAALLVGQLRLGTTRMGVMLTAAALAASAITFAPILAVTACV